MPTYRFSREEIYWRPLCTQKLNAETQNRDGLCQVCVYPVEMPPRVGCFCNSVTRPAGLPAAMGLRLEEALGPEADMTGYLSSSATMQRTGLSPRIAGGGVTYQADPTMIPADGTKESTAVINKIRNWHAPPSGTEFIVKNGSSYRPDLFGSNSCNWYAIEGTLNWRIHHATILEPVDKLEYTFVLNGFTRTGQVWRFDDVAPNEEITGSVNLSNNDMASVWLMCIKADEGFMDPVYWRQFVEQADHEIDPRVGGPCTPVPCNAACYPVDGNCCTFLGFDIPLNNAAYLDYIFNSYWDYNTSIQGYFWIVLPLDNGEIAALLVARQGAVWSEQTVTGSMPNAVSGFNTTQAGVKEIHSNSGGARGRLKAVMAANGAAAHYPLSYHNQPSVTSYVEGMPLSNPWTGTNLSAANLYGGGLRGTLRHPGWSESQGSILYSNPSSGGAVILAAWASNGLECSDEGEITLDLIADYRTTPNQASGTIVGGPSTFPEFVYLDIGDSGL